MIPFFPQFKKLEISDEQEIESMVSKADLKPYADFCFVNMWIWNTGNDMQVSNLNDNLVVMFRDYVSREAFLSFIGKNKLEETAKELIVFSKKNYKLSYLKLVPEEIARELQQKGFSAIEDEDSHDYVYLVSELKEMLNWGNEKGKKIRLFLQKHPNYKVSLVPLADIPTDELKDLFRRWGESKKIETVFDLNEYSALDRLLRLKNDNIKAVLFYIDNVLLGFTVYEHIKGTPYAISRFAKADVSFDSSMYDILNWEEAKIMYEEGIQYYNWEQDLGIPGLRYSKSKYNPAFFLKKFTVYYFEQ